MNYNQLYHQKQNWMYQKVLKSLTHPNSSWKKQITLNFYKTLFLKNKLKKLQNNPSEITQTPATFRFERIWITVPDTARR